MLQAAMRLWQQLQWSELLAVASVKCSCRGHSVGLLSR
jgi:hypothetical protein